MSHVLPLSELPHKLATAAACQLVTFNLGDLIELHQTEFIAIEDLRSPNCKVKNLKH